MYRNFVIFSSAILTNFAAIKKLCYSVAGCSHILISSTAWHNHKNFCTAEKAVSLRRKMLAKGTHWLLPLPCRPLPPPHFTRAIAGAFECVCCVLTLLNTLFVEFEYILLVCLLCWCLLHIMQGVCWCCSWHFNCAYMRKCVFSCHLE